jgi:hypothetical protein
LPPGTWHGDHTWNNFGVQTRAFVGVAADRSTTSVTLETRPGTALSTDLVQGAGNGTTIGGRPARVWAERGFATVVFRPAGDRVAEVTVERAGAAGPGLATVARQVAVALRFDRPERIDTDFTVTYAPRGLAVRQVDWGTTSATTYGMAGPTATQAEVRVQENRRTWSQDTRPFKLRATRGRAVQGRPTYVYAAVGGGQTVWVDELRPGVSIMVGGASGTPVAELYRVADGVRWTG